MKKIISIATVLMFIAQPILATEFNPSYIISDNEILDKTTMSLQDIQNFLDEKGGYIAGYKTIDYYGEKRTAAEIIYNAATNNYDCQGANVSDNPTLAEQKAKCKPISINPQFLLVLLQKEQSLLDDKNPTQGSLDWAVGYGCPDGSSCNDRWKGFGKQVNSASLQFYDYMINPQKFKYQVGETYIFSNPYDTINGKKEIGVTPANKATAALYNYTPHVYNGNYNFWRLWRSYFTKTLIEGSLVQVEGEPGVWLIQDGKKRPFLTQGALTSRYNPDKIITVKKTDLDGYLKGNPIKFAQYSILRSPQGSMYLIVGDDKRKILTPEIFRKLGFNPEEVENASSQDLSYYQDGEPITAEDAYPTGALIQDPESGGVYFVINNTKAPLIDPIFLKTKFKNYSVIKASSEELSKYEKIDPVKFEDGYLLKSNMSPSVYVISGGVKRPIASGKIFESLGYKWENIMEVHPRVLALYDAEKAITGASLKE